MTNGTRKMSGNPQIRLVDPESDSNLQGALDASQTSR